MSTLIASRVRHRRGEMYVGHGRLCVCLSLAAFSHYCMDPDVSRGNGRGCPLVVYYWAYLQSVHGFRCYDNIAPNAKCQRVLVLTSRSMPGLYSVSSAQFFGGACCDYALSTLKKACFRARKSRAVVCPTRMWASAQMMAALPNIGGALCSTPQSLADAHY